MDDKLINLMYLIYESTQGVLEKLTLTINQLFQNHNIDIKVPIFGDWSLIGLMFGAGIFLVLVYSLVKWLLDIVL